ncbi:tripartite tricarboxylate transporter substrate binding protein [Roseomonas sp. HJA6]|uniref:Tripartite tricarboxylate transporter substrate binding protein n=1 Tax=Roseomonas alba TaxID=2846776 RepID=A0ABS7A564_9PROT|nr:tripartite tricarboxylate transporter substrate binding protein [Neoroseomonas alba]MBW6397401.1 tripartite tricarboxylate transporter substrate binding protein [Neoroseomonas alba]
MSSAIPQHRPNRRPARLALGHLRRRRVVGASLALAAARSAAAQTPWPQRTVRLLVGLPPGGQADLLARGLAPHLATAFGQPFIVENRPGAGGTLAAAAVAQAHDLHALGFVLGGPTTTARALNPALSYDPARDFTPITLITRVPFVLTVHPALPARDWAGFVAYVKAHPGAVSYASIGPGTVTHLGMEELKARLGLDMPHVAYRGFPPATLDLVAGRVQAMFNVPSAALPQLQDGRLVAVVQTGEARLPTLPGVPTFAEAGLPDTAFFGWTGVVGPAGFPRAMAERVAAVIRAALESDPAARGGLDLAGSEILGTTPAAFAAHQAREAARWNAVVARLGLRVTD